MTRSRNAVLLAAMTLAACDTAGFKRSYMALDGQGDRKRDAFYTDTEGIFCVAELASGVADVTVRADFEQRAYYLPRLAAGLSFEGVTFGWVVRQFDGEYSINIEPGDFIAYYEPWDGLGYDT